MRSLFRTCTTSGNASATCVRIRNVNDLFQRNYNKYTRLDCDPHLPLTETLLLQHVYGWVPFNQNCTGGASANKLFDTPGVDYQATVTEYLALQYQNNGAFNPYTKLIHNKTFLDMDAYAFSIDDAVGFMHEPGGGLIITVGGTKGLANKKRFNRKKIVHVALGNDSKRPQWKRYSICTRTPNEDIDPNHPAFPIITADYPCRISVIDTKHRIYEFVARSGRPDQPTVGCGNSVSSDWCRAINVSQNNIGQWTFNTPPADP